MGSVHEEELKSEEERRLFYVAMTRAKKVLHLSYSIALPKTHFLNDIVTLSEEVFDEFSLSVSSLNAFLKCPLSFYFGKGLKLFQNK